MSSTTEHFATQRKVPSTLGAGIAVDCLMCMLYSQFVAAVVTVAVVVAAADWTLP